MNSFLTELLKVSFWIIAVLGLLILLLSIVLWIWPEFFLKAVALIGLLSGVGLLCGAVWILAKAKTP